jgi:hypothetical protein
MLHCLRYLILVYVAYLGLMVLWNLVRAVGLLLCLGVVVLAHLCSSPAPSPLPRTTAVGTLLTWTCLIIGGGAIVVGIGKFLVALGVISQ